ncbi:MAG: hypothetical protein IV100_11150 [Myxococcales bacterium]|nr:hypothetical protein [Myxococcales bacterium]
MRIAPAAPIVLRMTPLTARVKDGHLVLDVPFDLPDGTELELVVDDGGDTLSSSEREKLHAALEAGWKDIEAGRTIPLDRFLASFPTGE